MNDGTTRPVNSDLEDRLPDLLTPMFGKMRDASGLDGEAGIFGLDKPIEAENGKNQWMRRLYGARALVRSQGFCANPVIR